MDVVESSLISRNPKADRGHLFARNRTEVCASEIGPTFDLGR
jgi:hypothetical protein